MKLPITSLTPFDQLLFAKKRIPQYQRDFVWEPSLIGTFLDNIWEAFEAETKNYFCGSLVVFQAPDEVYEIVDGQQRTTVLYTLVSLLIEKMAIINGDQNFRGEEKNNRIYTKNPINRQLREFNFTHGNDRIENFYKAIGDGKPFDENSEEDITTKSLISCREEVTNFIESKFDKKNSDDIYPFYQYVLNNVNFTHFIASDITEALLVYSRLNSGGKPLGYLEIIKGQLFEVCQRESDDKWDSLERLWEEFWIQFKTPVQIGGFGKARDLINDETFLAYYFLVHNAELVDKEAKVNDGFLPSPKMSEFLLNANVRDKIFRSPDNFVRSLNTFVRRIVNYRIGKGDNTESQDMLKDIALLSGSQTQPLMFLLTCSQKGGTLFQAMLRNVRSLVFIFSMSVTGTGSTSIVWKQLSKLIRDNRKKHPDDEIINLLNQQIEKVIDQYWIQNFLPFLENCSLKTDRRKIKVILLICEIAAREKANVSKEKNYHNFYRKQGFDVDHLTPVSTSDEDYVDRIGNAALLGSAANRGLGKTAFEDKEKQLALSKSSVYSTRALVTKSEQEHGADAKIMDMFSVIETHNEDSANKRKEEIAKCLHYFVYSNFTK